MSLMLLCIAHSRRSANSLIFFSTVATRALAFFSLVASSFSLLSSVFSSLKFLAPLIAVVSKDRLDYIFGNPPFLGARMMSVTQKNDMTNVFGKLKGLGNLDYVTAWYKKAAEIMNGTEVKAAFVSTNSIAQGEQPAILWKPLMESGVFINFCVPTFKWVTEAAGDALCDYWI